MACASIGEAPMDSQFPCANSRVVNPRGRLFRARVLLARLSLCQSTRLLDDASAQSPPPFPACILFFPHMLNKMQTNRKRCTLALCFSYQLQNETCCTVTFCSIGKKSREAQSAWSKREQIFLHHFDRFAKYCFVSLVLFRKVP